MGKINIKAHLVSDEENLIIETSGIKSKNKIIYKENDISVTILMFENKIEMERISKDYKINLIFDKNKKTVSTYQIFGGSKTFNLETKTKKLIINDKKIELNYELEGNKFKYTLEMEAL